MEPLEGPTWAGPQAFRVSGRDFNLGFRVYRVIGFRV